MSLDVYQAKRDFTRTSEPNGDKLKKVGEPTIFVIQKHAASHLHYDFRLEIGGVLKSWAVPKGPSTDPSIKRMAIPTEDHPYDYAYFEGTIPKGEYGGGIMMIWDRGNFKNIKTDQEGKSLSLKESYKQGTIEIFLSGTKLRGGYTLVKMKSGRMAGNWLLSKMKDEFMNADDILLKLPNSVVSGKSMEEIGWENRSG